MNQSLGYEILQVMPLAVGTGLFVSLASFTEPPTLQGPTGNLIGDFTPVDGLQGITCMDAPDSKAKENQQIEQIRAESYRHVLLSACYPAVTQAAGLGWRVTIDGLLYDLVGAEDDSQRTMTRCFLQLVTL